jgi:cytochrome c-type biogenesis protein CcmF
MYKDRYEFRISNIRPDRESKENSSIEITITDMKAVTVSPQQEKRDILVVEASIKPYINLVWNGVIILLVGLIVTIVRRSQEARLRRVGTS